MFFKPNLALNSHTGTKYDLYSDWHKEAFGCRPGARQSLGYDLMSVEERQVEHATVDAWFAEDERIRDLRTEVARFDFSRRMEYLMRREGISEREAFARTCANGHSYCDPEDEMFDDFEAVCYEWSLPYSDASALQAKWTELNS